MSTMPMKGRVLGMPVPPSPLGGILLPGLGGFPGATPAPTPGTAQQQPQQASPQGFGGKLMGALSDPRMSMLLLSLGAGLTRPRGFGETGMGQAVNSMLGGFNTLAMADEVRRQRQMEAEKFELEKRRVAATETGVKAEAGLRGAQTKQTEAETKALPGKEEREGKKLDLLKLATESEVSRRKAQTEGEQARLEFDKDKLERDYMVELGRLTEMERTNKSRTEIEKQKLKLEESRNEAYRAQAFAMADQHRALAAKAKTSTGGLDPEQMGNLRRQYMRDFMALGSDVTSPLRDKYMKGKGKDAKFDEVALQRDAAAYAEQQMAEGVKFVESGGKASQPAKPTLSQEAFQHYWRLSGGDKEKVRQMAIKDGWDIK